MDEDSRHAYGGVIVFDEAHAMANAAGAKGSRGDTAPSQQGRAGLRLQNALPDARILYVSATGATTVPGLAYARRLGLWGGADSGGETPFEQRTDFVTAMEAGGVAAMEVVARDLKALGLYQARALSYDGVEVEPLEHPLTPEQRRIYDAYAGAFKVIHRNMEDALKATGIMEGEATLNKNAKAAALSAFEGAKQRFFGHLLTAMKCPSLIRAIEADLEAGHACVIQLVSTGEALLDRRIAGIPVSEWDDISVDLTPREACLEYLAHAFPVQLQEPFTDDEGNLMSRPVTDAGGNPVLCQEAVAARDALIEKLAALPPVQAALDQILHRFGGEAVAEVTGRSRRVLRIADASGERLALRNRPASANLAETAAFMAGDKRILVFSMAGGTGRSYHADLGCGNTRRRIHYLLEPGWRADQAIQGLGRTHRTHQAPAPLFRPVTTDVKGERRFIATIARRLDSLGAITRGQRDSQTAMGGGDATLFRASDNLESPYAKVALRQFYIALWRGNIAGWSMDRFEDATGLKLIWEGSLKEDLPPMPRFLNRLLALPIAEQNELFAELEARIEANIEQAFEAGTHEQGVETIRADSLTVASRETVHVHEASGAATELVEIARRDRLVPLMAGDALALRDGRPVINTRSKRAAVVLPAPSRMFEDGGVEARVRLARPAAASPWPRPSLPPRTGRRQAGIAGARCGMRRSKGCPATPNPACGWSPACCSPSGTGCRARTCGCAGLRPTPGTPARPGPHARAGARLPRRLRAGRRTGHEFGRDARGDPDPRASFDLANGWRLARRRLMGAGRVEIEGPADGDLAALKRLGCTTEIVSWRPVCSCPNTSASAASSNAGRSRLRARRKPARSRPVSGAGACQTLLPPATRTSGNLRLCAAAAANCTACHRKDIAMPSSHTLPDDPVYAFCPSYDLDNMPQQIRIVFDSMPGYVPTALVALSLEDALRICDRLNARIGLDRDAWSAIAARACPPLAMKPPIEPYRRFTAGSVPSACSGYRQVGQAMSRDPPTRMLRLIEAEGSTAGTVRRCTGGNSPGIAAILSCNARRNPMFDTLTPRSTTGDFETMPGARPDPGGFLPEAPDRYTRSRSSHEGSGGTIRRVAERHHAPARQSVSRRPRRAPPPASPFGEHDHERQGQPRRRHHRHHGRQRRGPLTTRSAAAGQSRATGCRRAMPPNSPACLDQRAREVEEGKEKGDAPKGKESSHRAVSQPHQAEMPDVRSHS